MKTLTKLFTLLLLVSIISCGDDSCEPGFEGENCDVLINETFFGTYSTTASDCGSGNTSTLDSITLAADPDGDGQSVIIEHTRSGQTGTGTGTIINGVLDGSSSDSSVSFKLDGTISGNIYTGSADAAAGSLTVTCTITMEK